tara:strand:+ start:2527 stop:2853 length:327 start_codon:yes stop_codon:yes gene_type:complete
MPEKIDKTDITYRLQAWVPPNDLLNRVDLMEVAVLMGEAVDSIEYLRKECTSLAIESVERSKVLAFLEEEVTRLKKTLKEPETLAESLSNAGISVEDFLRVWGVGSKR